MNERLEKLYVKMCYKLYEKGVITKAELDVTMRMDIMDQKLFESVVEVFLEEVIETNNKVKHEVPKPPQTLEYLTGRTNGIDLCNKTLKTLFGGTNEK